MIRIRVDTSDWQDYERALERAERFGWDGAIADALEGFAGDVLPRVSDAYRSLYPDDSAASSLQVVESAGVVTIEATAAWWAGRDMGAVRYPQFPSYVPGGRVMYPTIEGASDEIDEAMWSVVDEALYPVFGGLA